MSTYFRFEKTLIHSLLVSILLLLLTGCMESSEVQMVKNGSLGGCPAEPLGELADGFFGDPVWNSGVADSGQSFVNVEGDFIYAEKEVRGLLQFYIHPEAGEFKFNAFEINGVPQNNLMAMTLLQKMCDSSSETVVDNVNSGLAAILPSMKLIVSESCMSDPSMRQLSKAALGMEDYISENLQSPYVDEVEVSGSCADGENVTMTFSMSDAVGTGSFEIVFKSNGTADNYQWTCTTNGKLNHVPEFCRN